jgi:hypothetical protein
LWKRVFSGAQEIFSTMIILAPLPGKNSRFALKQFSRRALRRGVTAPEKIFKSPPPKTHFHNRRGKRRKGKEKEHGH